MNRSALSGTIGVFLALGVCAAPAQAQLARTWVSSLGSNTGNCDRPTPCRTFQFAHDNTLPLGEITVLDPGGYGALTINRAISVINDGVGEAGVLVSGGAVGITIAAGASDAVSLRGITVKGIGFGGGDGIRFNSGKSLTIENCALRNHTGSGIVFAPSASSSLAVSNTFVSDNGVQGIVVVPTGAVSLSVVLNRVELYNNGFAGLNVSGSTATGTIAATVTDSVAANNSGGGGGFLVQSTAGHAVSSLLVVRSTASDNSFGVQSFGPAAAARVGQSSVYNNSTGMSGNVASYGDNRIDLNTGGNSGFTIIPLK